ncbi:MAG: glycosyltransferase family 4 protein [Bacteroidota bacterium]
MEQLKKPTQIIVSHPTGNANVRHALQGFVNSNILAQYFTSVAVFEHTFLDKLSKIGAFSELKRRFYDASLEQKTKNYPWFEVGRIIAPKIGFPTLTAHESGIFSTDSCFQNLDKYVARHLDQFKDLNAVYNYEDTALQTFRKAKKNHLSTFYDLPTGYWKAKAAFIQQEMERNADWSIALDAAKDSPEKLRRKDEELSLADQVIVASSFTKSTLQHASIKLKKIQVIPYGFPKTYQSRTYQSPKNRKLKALFVGRLSQQKGLSYLFEAIAKFSSEIELTLVGSKTTNNFDLLDEHLSKHTWLPYVRHQELLKLMREHDFLIFPSLFDGFGLVITESMSQGTPVIATQASAAPDLIENGKNGWIISSGSTDTLVQCLEHIIQDKSILEIVGKAALRRAEKRPWKQYEEELSNTVIGAVRS